MYLLGTANLSLIKLSASCSLSMRSCCDWPVSPSPPVVVVLESDWYSISSQGLALVLQLRSLALSAGSESPALKARHAA